MTVLETKSCACCGFEHSGKYFPWKRLPDQSGKGTVTVCQICSQTMANRIWWLDPPPPGSVEDIVLKARVHANCLVNHLVSSIDEIDISR